MTTDPIPLDELLLPMRQLDVTWPEYVALKGIIFFNGYWWRTTDTTRPTGDHIDLWNGWRTSANMLFPWFGWLGLE